jgi:hypothetical protein
MSSSEAVVAEFTEKYPIGGGRWTFSNRYEYICECGSEIYTGEVYYSDSVGRYCARCGIEKFNNASGHAVEKQQKQESKYEPPDSTWIIMSDNTCYYCGTKNCDHIKNL